MPVGDDILVLDYVPYDLLFPYAAVNIHQGGIGTLAQAMAAGKPMLVIPFSHDQPDNAERARRLGIAATLPHARFSVDRAVAALRPLLEDPAYARTAATVGTQIRAEDGLAAACEHIEATLAATHRPPPH